MSASTLTGDKLVNPGGETLGKIDEIGGFLGAGDKLFAIPGDQLSLDEDNKQFVLDIDHEKLKQAPGFDKNNWPDMADPTWSSRIYSYYGSSPREE